MDLRITSVVDPKQPFGDRKMPLRSAKLRQAFHHMVEPGVFG